MEAGDFDTAVHMDVNPVPELLYHYTTAPALAGILHSRSFRLSDLARTNDPRESKMLRLYVERRGEDGTRTELAPIDFTTRVRAGVKVACMTVDRDPLPSDAIIDGQGYLHRGFARPRNWSQYADHHRGACLFFGRDSFVNAAVSKAQEVGLYAEHGPVAYYDRQTDSRADGTLLHLGIDDLEADPSGLAASIRREWSKELFFTKFVDWASECEYRVAVFGLTQEAVFEVPIGRTLVGIMLGVDYPPSEVAVLSERLRLAGAEGTWVGQMDWSDNLPYWAELRNPRYDAAT